MVAACEEDMHERRLLHCSVIEPSDVCRRSVSSPFSGPPWREETRRPVEWRTVVGLEGPNILTPV